MGKDTRMVFVAGGGGGGGESWTIKPYARKWDAGSGARVREVTLKLVDGYAQDRRCSVNHTVPAMVFAIGGWTGNYFHDFVDVLVPLFETAYHFGGEVQFLIANLNRPWMDKYQLFFKKLSRYEIIEYDDDDAIRCFKHVTLGLRCTSAEDFQMEPSKSPHGYTMFDFAKFARGAFSLERDYASRMGEETDKKPRLMVITRATTRRFMNVEEIVRMAEEVGYEVVVTEGDPDVSKFSRIVNSCDVLMGVHGSALTNMVFLPTNAVVIQVVPWGNLDWIAGHYFRDPSDQMKLNYLEYSISEEETTLTELYPREHAVFKDPMSLHPQNADWDTFSRIFLKEQNVKLDVTRFRAYLERALRILRHRRGE
ncbi:alpha-1,3-arabinosyltransferase XAT3 isoform X2 [Musa acuminata AAA Group]